MSDGVYKVIEIIGASKESLGRCSPDREQACEQDTRDLRVAEVVRQDLIIEAGKVEASARS